MSAVSKGDSGRQRAGDNDVDNAPSVLSKREREIASRAARGASNLDIAREFSTVIRPWRSISQACLPNSTSPRANSSART